MSAWGSILGGVNMMIHAAGWLEGGLTASMEKYILDIEILQIFAEVFQPLDANEPELAFEAIAEVEPGGHFFAAQHTMERYRAPSTRRWCPTGAISEAGARTAARRRRCARTASGRRSSPLRAAEDGPGRAEALANFVARRTRRRRPAGVVSAFAPTRSAYAALAARCLSIAALRKLAIQWATMAESASRVASDCLARSMIGAATIGFSRTS